MTRKNSLIPLLSLLLLLIPLIAMQFTDQVYWTALDFVIMGVLLLAVSFGIQFILKRQAITPKGLGLIALVVLSFLLLWVELAVGIFGSPIAGS